MHGLQQIIRANEEAIARERKLATIVLSVRKEVERLATEVATIAARIEDKVEDKQVDEEVDALYDIAGVLVHQAGKL